MKEPWTYQQYDPATRTFFPVLEDCDVTMHESDPDEDPVDVWAEAFARRDARRRQCRVASIR